MKKSLDKYIEFHRKNGGTGKLFKFKFLDYKEGYLELEGEFNEFSLNPDGSVQGGMMTSMLDDVTSLLIIFETKGQIYPASTDLHSLHHRPLSKGKIRAKASIIKIGKNIASTKGELVDKDDRVIATLMHTAYLVHKPIK
ncbi:MAG: PaaI family thioesterase [Candidatus Neomarinimicrobiota bacterium]|tara:strand:+ start:5764 stop:6183 length:420 start_codon:yes stop_codon:yes gene_type:complete